MLVPRSKKVLYRRRRPCNWWQAQDIGPAAAQAARLKFAHLIVGPQVPRFV